MKKMNKKEKDKLESDILKNIEYLQSKLIEYLVKEGWAKLYSSLIDLPHRQIREQLKCLQDMLAFIHLTKPITWKIPSTPEQDKEMIKKIKMGYVGDQNAPIPIYKGDDPLYRDSVGAEELNEN